MRMTNAVPPSVADDLPQETWGEVAELPEQLQAEFVREYRANAKSRELAYLLWFAGLHYAYFGKWRWLAYFWLAALPVFIWWIIDGLRLPGMVRSHNLRLARDILHYMRTIAS